MSVVQYSSCTIPPRTLSAPPSSVSLCRRFRRTGFPGATKKSLTKVGDLIFCE